MKRVSKKLWSNFYNNLIGGYELWHQMLNIAVVIAIIASFASVIVSLIMGSSIISIIAYLISAVFAEFCLIISLRMKNITYAAIPFCLVANFVLFPIMFFTSGGIHGGMPLWLLLSLVISWVVIRNRAHYVIYILSVVFQSACIMFSIYYPEYVIGFQSDEKIAKDVIQSLIIVSLIFGLIIRYMGFAYDRKKKELDEANALLHEMNERITLHSMYTLAKTIDAKDKYTNGHSMRVAKYSRMIAEKMGFPEAELEEIYNMGMLHDIGKIGVPDDIINKTSKLTDKEYYIIKTHPVIGYDILSEMEEAGDIGIGARWHHERYDGKGYPDGLAGEDIPLKARIISVADAYDAMTSNRSYRTYMPQNDVMQEIIKGRGTQFDPEIAKVMLDIMLEDKDYELHEQ